MTARQRLVVGAVATAVVLTAAVALPYMVDRFLINVLTLALTFGLLAISINLLAGYAGLASLGHAGIMAVSAYGVAVVALRTDLGFVAQPIIGLVLGILAAGVFGLLSMRTGGVYFLMATLAAGMVVWGLTIRWTSVTGGENGLRGIARPPLVEEYWAMYYLTLAVVVIAVVAMWVITRSPFGLVLRGIMNNETRLRMLGYNPEGLKVYAFALSGVFAGAAGVLFLYYNRFVSPSAAGFLTSGKAVLMVLLGGAGTIFGPILGGIVITGVENVVSTYTARWPTVLGLLYILTVLFARDGVVGLFNRTLRRVTGDAVPPATPEVSVAMPESPPPQPTVARQFTSPRSGTQGDNP